MKTAFEVLLITLFVSAPPGALTGKWETFTADGNILGLIFKPDNHFEGYVNRKPFVSGTYTFNNDAITMNGNGCVDIPGKYTIHFFSHADSIRWEIINDSCEARRKGLNNVTFGRVK